MNALGFLPMVAIAVLLIYGGIRYDRRAGA